MAGRLHGTAQSERTDGRIPCGGSWSCAGAHARPAARVRERYGVVTPHSLARRPTPVFDSDVKRLSVGTWLVHMELHERRSSVSSLPAACSGECAFNRRRIARKSGPDQRKRGHWCHAVQKASGRGSCRRRRVVDCGRRGLDMDDCTDHRHTRNRVRSSRPATGDAR